LNPGTPEPTTVKISRFRRTSISIILFKDIPYSADIKIRDNSGIDAKEIVKKLDILAGDYCEN